MAATTRQPFAPLDGARLQTLNSLKNRQNAVSKRKADILAPDDCENVDPVSSVKRRAKDSGVSSQDVLKSVSSFVFTKAVAATPPPSATVRALVSPVKANTSPRRILQPRSPIAKLNTAAARSSPISAPAGRSPTRGKRSGILSTRRRTIGPYTRVDPPSFPLASSVPFSLDAALKGTIAGFGSRPRSNAMSTGSSDMATRASTNSTGSSSSSLRELDAKASWFFDIHEDSPEQEMTNLLQHGTCVLDISSDEESEEKSKRETAEGRNKENVPPPDDISQTSARRAARARATDEMVVEKERIALGEMNTLDFYADGCDEGSIVIVPGDDEESAEAVEANDTTGTVLAASSKARSIDVLEGIDQLMAKPSSSSSATKLQPIEGSGESFDLWESDSLKDGEEGDANES